MTNDLTLTVTRKRIVTLQDLYVARSLKQSVIAPSFGGFDRPRPAAFMMNLTGEVLLRMMNSGMYVYKPQPKISKTRTFNKKGK